MSFFRSLFPFAPTHRHTYVRKNIWMFASLDTFHFYFVVSSFQIQRKSISNVQNRILKFTVHFAIIDLFTFCWRVFSFQLNYTSNGFEHTTRAINTSVLAQLKVLKKHEIYGKIIIINLLLMCSSAWWVTVDVAHIQIWNKKWYHNNAERVCTLRSLWMMSSALYDWCGRCRYY